MDEALLQLSDASPLAEISRQEVPDSFVGRPASVNEPCQGQDFPSVENSHRRARSILVIASRFPPVASVGAIRVRKFVKYLPQFGWNPVVITGASRSMRTSRHDARRASDHSSLEDIPANVPVHRISAVLDNWPGFATRRATNLFSNYTRGLGLDEAWWNGVIKWRLQKLHDTCAFPDRGIWRLPFVARLAQQLHRKHRFDAIFSTGMPFSDHIVGLTVASMLRRPWIADFRDPWVEYIHWRQWEGGAGCMLTKWSEAAVIARAAGIISVNDHMTARFRDRYPNHVRKFATIENGYDPDDFKGIETVSPGRRFRLLHAGSLYDTRSPVSVLAAWRHFIDETPGSAEYARLEFAGRVGSFADEMNRPEDRGTIIYHGMLPHDEALAAMVSADANLIILPDLPGSESDTTAKMYECIGAGRAILATVPTNGAAARELRRHDGVWLTSPNDVEEISRAIGGLYRRWLSGSLRLGRDTARLSSVTRRYQTGQLAGLLEMVSKRRKRRHEVTS